MTTMHEKATREEAQGVLYPRAEFEAMTPTHGSDDSSASSHTPAELEAAHHEAIPHEGRT